MHQRRNSHNSPAAVRVEGQRVDWAEVTLNAANLVLKDFVVEERLRSESYNTKFPADVEPGIFQSVRLSW